MLRMGPNPLPYGVREVRVTVTPREGRESVTVTVHLIKRENKYEILIVVRFVILC